MKLKNKKSLLCLALLGLGLGTVSGCAGGSAITFELNNKAAVAGECYLGVTYTLTAKIELEKPVFTFKTDATTAFTFKKVSDNSVQFTAKKTGNFTIFAQLEGDAESTASFPVTVTKGEETYKLEADTSGMNSDVFKQGEPFNSEGLIVYQRAYVDGQKGEKHATSDYKLSIEEGQILDMAGEIEVQVISTDQAIESTSFTIIVSENPSFLADKFFSKLGNNFSTLLVDQSNAYVSMVRNDRYILSYENGYGFFVDEKDKDKGIRAVTMMPNAEGTAVEFEAGRQLFIDAFASETQMDRGIAASLDAGESLMGLASGDEYNSKMFNDAQVGKLTDGTLMFTLPANSDGALYLLSLVGYKEYVNYGFKMVPTCFFVEDEKLGPSCFIQIDATIGAGQSQQKLQMTYLLTSVGQSGDAEFDKYLTTDYKINPRSYEALNSAAKIITDGNFTASDYGTFTETPNKDGIYSVFFSTADSYMSSLYAGGQYLKQGFFEIPEGKTKPAGHYKYVSQTKDGKPEVTQLVGEDEKAYDFFSTKNWMGFVDGNNPNNDWKGQNTLEQWYLESAVPNKKDNTTSYTYKFVGFYSSLKWYNQATFQNMLEYFATESMTLNVVIGNDDNLVKGLSMMLRGETAGKGVTDFGKTYGVCNLEGYEIDVNSVGKTTNKYIDSYLESITKPQQ